MKWFFGLLVFVSGFATAVLLQQTGLRIARKYFGRPNIVAPSASSQQRDSRLI
jgi:hypothetical protein